MTRKQSVWSGILLGSVLLLALNGNGMVAQTGDPQKDLKTLNGYFPFEPPQRLETWQARRKLLQQHLQVSLGLWPMPQKTPLKPVVHGKIEMKGYTIEKVFFESLPGFYVTGNLYRPSETTGRNPGVLCPHGHWAGGRFMYADDAEVKRQLEGKGERFESNARSPLQSRCATLAKNGCIVFHYDMIGYADSQQIPSEIAHGFRKQREHMNSRDGWGLFSPQAEMRSQSVMGLQTWNSIRSLDFLASLPDVDPDRIGVTGASGGGTQTFILCALDPRPAVAFPAVMVSTAMQGGCTCENCCNLRVGQGNVEIAALFAPKPMGLTAASDWTKEMRTKGMPELKSLYGLYGAADNVTLMSRLEFGHNYNRIGRMAMYDWFHQHLQLEKNETETEIEVLKSDRLTVYNAKHARPRGGDPWEKAFLKKWESIANREIDLSSLDYVDEVERYHSFAKVALKSLVNLIEKPVRLKIGKGQKDDSLQTRTSSCLLYSENHEQKSAVILHESTKQKREITYCIYLTGDGLAGNGKALSGSAKDAMQKAASNHATVVGIDLVRQQGPFGQEKTNGNRLVENGREAAGYTFGYNRTIFAWRVQQVFDLVRYLKDSEPDAKIQLFADAAVSPVALYVAALSRQGQLDQVVVDSDGFRFANIKRLTDIHFNPGIVKFGDVDGLVTMAVINGISVQLRGEKLSTLPHSTRVSKLLGRIPVENDSGWGSWHGHRTVPTR